MENEKQWKELTQKDIDKLTNCKKLQKFEWFTYGMLAVLIPAAIVSYILGRAGFVLVSIKVLG
jgi:hypothetical protein